MTYITAAIDYLNAKPHIGHAYEKIVADAFARWSRLKGEKTFFSVGTDEHGQKVFEAAEQQGKPTKQFVDELAKVFQDFFKDLNLSNDTFIRTTSPHHKEVVNELIEKAKEDIYKGDYEGWYCKGCEAFYTEQQLADGKCPEDGKEEEKRKEESYFFKLSKYQEQLKEYLQGSVIVPTTRKNEILRRLEEPLKDLSITRLQTKLPWGIPFPLDDKHVVYVWFDALTNYLSAPGKSLQEYWPADAHVIGKDIAWFHCVIWPAMLLATGYELPKHVYVHGFINDKNGQKMSKSVGNVIDPSVMLKKYGTDALRYYLLRTMVSGEDGNFDEEELVARYNGEVANEYGNLVSRGKALTLRFFEGKLKKTGKDAFSFTHEAIDKHMQSFKYHKAVEGILEDLHKINAYVSEKEPWKNEKEREEVLYNILEGLRFVSHYLYPFIPASVEKVAEQLGFSLTTLDKLEWGTQNYALKEGKIPFPKLEYEVDEFPLDLRIGKITNAEHIEGADKLYKEEVDFGTEKRQIVSGLAKDYTPRELMGKNVIVVCNLKKAKLKGVESYGMLLAAEHDGKLTVVEAPKSNPGDAVNVDGMENRKARISFEEFLKVKLEIKDKKLLANGKQLKTDKEILDLDVPNSSVR